MRNRTTPTAPSAMAWISLALGIMVLVMPPMAALGHASAGSLGPQPGSPWPMLHGNSGHTGASRAPGGALGRVRWSFQTEATVGSSPAVAADGTIYVGSYDTYLYALKPDGSLLWKYKTGDHVISSPAIGADGTVYVGADGLYALHPDGTLQWRVNTGGPVASSPAIGHDGTIYVGSDDAHLYAVRPDGSIQWKFATKDKIVSSPAIGSDGTIYVGSNDRYVYAVRPNGTRKWRYRTGWGVEGNPVVAPDGTVYVGADALYAFRPNGRLKWKLKGYGPPSECTPAVAPDGTIYASGWDGVEGFLYALRSSGAVKWKVPLAANGSSSPVVAADGTIYVGTLEPEHANAFGTPPAHFYAIRPDGSVQWDFTTVEDGTAFYGSPSIGADGTVYAGSMLILDLEANINKGIVYAFH